MQTRMGREPAASVYRPEYRSTSEQRQANLKGLTSSSCSLCEPPRGTRTHARPVPCRATPRRFASTSGSSKTMRTGDWVPWSSSVACGEVAQVGGKAGEAGVIPTGLWCPTAANRSRIPEDVIPLAVYLASLPERGLTVESYSLLRRYVWNGR